MIAEIMARNAETFKNPGPFYVEWYATWYPPDYEEKRLLWKSESDKVLWSAMALIHDAATGIFTPGEAQYYGKLNVDWHRTNDKDHREVWFRVEFDADDKPTRVIAERRWIRGKGAERVYGFFGYTHDKLATARDGSNLAYRTQLWNWLNGENVWKDEDAAEEHIVPELGFSS